MIVVTGTKRSGTSLWMRILAAGGFEVIGSRWPRRWKQSIGSANPEGFHESLFREGVYHRTNPHPQTGRYLAPESVRRHAVKVFVPGLVRSDVAFLDHVICTIRPWSEYRDSIVRLHAMEDAHILATQGSDAVERVRTRRPALPPELEWWRDNYALVRDIATRRYPYHLVALDTLVRDPESTLDRVFSFVGGGDVEQAAALVDADWPRSDAKCQDSHVVDRWTIGVFEALYATIAEGRALSGGLISDMNRVNARLFDKAAPASRAG